MELNYHAVLDALAKASSQNAQLLKDAERQLQSWQHLPGFHSVLLNIATDGTLDLNIRWLSVLCTKNGIDSRWRNTALNSIPAEEKQIIKQKLLTCINEPISQIALQLAVIISKIARSDFPKDWEDLFPVLLNGMQSGDQLYQLRALLIMYHVIKSLATKRLGHDRRIFQQVTATIFSTILNQWINYSKLFLKEAQENMSNSSQLLESSFFCLKILRKLIVYGFKDYSKEPDAVNFLSFIYQQFGPFFECRSVLKNNDHLQEMCEKYLVNLVKILRDLLDIQPFSFVQFIQPTLECGIMLCFSKLYQDKLFERLIVQFLNLIKSIITCVEYKPKKCNEETKSYAMTVEAHKIMSEFFTLPVLTEICDQLLSRYFLLTENDIENWESNPEEFASEEGVESWKFSLRPCTEVFFLALFREFRNLLTPLVVEIQKSVQVNGNNDSMSILKKEAVYNVIGLAAFDLYDEIDFDSWFTNVLIPELRIKSNGYYIIRRRVIWLLGEWVGVKMSMNMRPVLYQLLLQFLGNEENLIVRLTAAKTLKTAIDDFEFNDEHFIPYLEHIIVALFTLLREVKECDLKMSVLSVLTIIIERLGPEVNSHVNSLMLYLPQLWNSCGDHNMLRCAIISCFVQLVHSLQSLSETLHSSLLPMIALATDVSQPPHVYLLEDGLELWWAIIQNATVCSPELLNLATNLIGILEFNNESLRMCLQIIEGYIMLDKENFLNRYGQTVVSQFMSSVTDLKSEGILKILNVVETAFIVFPKDGPLLFQPFLGFVLNLALQPNELPIAMCVYLSLLSRVILHNLSCFVNIIQEHAIKEHSDVNTIFKKLLDVWLEKMPLMSPTDRAKLLALALTCLLTSGSEVVHDCICGIFLAVTEVLNDVMGVDSDIEGQSEDHISLRNTDMLVARPDFKDDDEVQELEHEKRKLELFKTDVVYTVDLRKYLYNQVMALRQSVGEAKFQDLMSTVDCETMQQLKEYLENCK